MLETITDHYQEIGKMLTKRILLLFSMLVILSPALLAQTITTGDITGVILDSTGAVVPNATVTIKSSATGESRTALTNATGAYRFTLLKPGAYEISAESRGLKSDIVTNAIASVGQITNLNLTLKPTVSTEIVTVTAAPFILQTESPNITSTFSSAQLSEMPTPGGDITTVAFSVPGVNVSTGAGYGNFTAHGIPGTSNLFTTNGNDNMDPYLNLNNSGASNLTLGQNEIQEASVVQNAYSSQYGRQAGAQVNFITKSGSDKFHANMLYNYNGATLNANDFFNNASGTPRGQAISNQYGVSLGGPIVKEKLFFFVDHESLRYNLPTTGAVAIPSQAFQSYILANLPTAQRAYYQNAFSLYNSAPGVGRAVPVANGDGILQDSNESLGCGTFAGTPTGTGGVFGVNVSCANAFVTNVSGANSEWLLSGRVDWNVSDKQRVSFRFKTDQGEQPTETSPINAAFNAISKQPAYEGQMNHFYVISPSMVNSLILSGSYYSAIFGPSDLAAAVKTFPSELVFYDGGANGANDGGGGFTQMGLSFDLFPQGRRVQQMQVIDDFSYIRGHHALKFGLNFRSNRITDTGNNRLIPGGRFRFFGVDEFANGSIDPASGSTYSQKFTPFASVHLRVYNIGFYAQDDWTVNQNLKLTLGLRVDRNGNPSCSDNCFTRFVTPFNTMTKGTGLPYNQSIQTGLSNAFYDMQAASLQPRLGFAYNPSTLKHTVIRGGMGLFSDLSPATLVSPLFGNSPNVFTPGVRTGTVNSGGTGSAPAIAVATGNAFQTGFAKGYTLAQLQAALAPVTFTEPGFTTVAAKMITPQYLEWSLDVQQEFEKNLLTISYVGNHGYNLILRDAWVNSWVNTTGTYKNGFGGLQNTAPDARFRNITEINNNGYSNYNGLSISFRRRLSYGFSGDLSYTWSHALDTVSNGGILYYSSDSLTTQAAPGTRDLSYSNADYDIRHNFTADTIWELPFKASSPILNRAISGWSFSSKWYIRTGTPFSVYNNGIPSRLSVASGGATSANLNAGVVLADVISSTVNRSCSSVDTACFTTSQFKTTTQQTDFGNQPRNSFRGPGYFNVDASLSKKIAVREGVQFAITASAFNLFNHANFANPGQNVSSSGLGVISSTVGPPTSPYGSFQGSAVSGRVLVVGGKLSF
jgi:outer membrane receptor protein involved in Fe transport